MNSEINESEAMSPNAAPTAEKVKVDMQTGEPGSLTKMNTNANASEQWHKIRDQVKAILSELPDYVGEFFNEYRRPIITITLVVTGLITAKVTLAVLEALNDVPLLAPTFELIGIGYAAWFTYRYLLKANDRQELLHVINSLKDQVIGQVTRKD